MTTKQIKYVCERVTRANEIIEQCEVLLMDGTLNDNDAVQINELIELELSIKDDLMGMIYKMISTGVCECELIHRGAYQFMKYAVRES